MEERKDDRSLSAANVKQSFTSADPQTTAAVANAATTGQRDEAWYHADFCHAFAWVYEDGEKLRVRWAERTGSDLYLHSKSDCDRCREIRKDEHAARDGEFTMEKPPEEFSSATSFFHVLAEIGKYVPGLIEDET